MLSDLQSYCVAVPPQFDDLILDSLIARTSTEGKVEKTATQLDLFDTLRLCTKHYRSIATGFVETMLLDSVKAF